MSIARSDDSEGSYSFGRMNRPQRAEASQAFVSQPRIAKTPHAASSTTHANNDASRPTSTQTSNSSTIRYFCIHKNQ